jgi:hypothetical protein
MLSTFGSLLLATISFVTPQEGGQVIGRQVIEAVTDATDVDRVEFIVDGALAGVARQAPYRITFDFGTSPAGREITANVFSNGYRDTSSATIRTAALTAGESINVDVVEVPLKIRAGRTVGPDDLRVRENAVEQTIREIKPGRGPAHFAFVVDRSLSMGGGRLSAALEAVDRVRRLLRPDDTLSLILFNHSVTKHADVPADIVPSGGTSLRDAVSAIPGRDRTYAIVITDGGDRNSRLSEEEALRTISGTKTIVAALVFGAPGSFLRQATKNTAGTLTKTTRETLGRDLQNAIADINSRYTLIYQSHGTGSGWRSIDVAPRRRGVQIVSARKGYFSE